MTVKCTGMYITKDGETVGKIVEDGGLFVAFGITQNIVTQGKSIDSVIRGFEAGVNYLAGAGQNGVTSPDRYATKTVPTIGEGSDGPLF